MHDKSSSSPRALLWVKGVKKYFPVTEGTIFRRHIGLVKAVDGISFDLRPGETLALVGESGCGKSTMGRLALALMEPTDGQIVYDGKDMAAISKKRLRSLRREIQIIFQDPFASLNPRLTVAEILGEPLDVHSLAKGEAKEKRIDELLNTVGLSSWHKLRYPHEFSGGQRQRIGIARALAGDPKLIVCDEPVSALDVSIQAQMINLIMDLQRRFGLTYLFISHDMAVVKHVSHRIAVMYLGKFVELADRDELFDNPRHPYTHALLSAVPIADPVLKRKRMLLDGDVPSPMNPPSGCTFHPRCPFATDLCRETEPSAFIESDSHQVTCHHWRSINPRDNYELGKSEEDPRIETRLRLYRDAMKRSYDAAPAQTSSGSSAMPKDKRIKVKRPVTQPPPHRSRRAVLPHRALRICSLTH